MRGTMVGIAVLVVLLALMGAGPVSASPEEGSDNLWSDRTLWILLPGYEFGLSEDGKFSGEVKLAAIAAVVEGYYADTTEIQLGAGAEAYYYPGGEMRGFALSAAYARSADFSTLGAGVSYTWRPRPGEGHFSARLALRVGSASGTLDGGEVTGASVGPLLQLGYTF